MRIITLHSTALVDNPCTRVVIICGGSLIFNYLVATFLGDIFFLRLNRGERKGAGHSYIYVHIYIYGY